MHKEENLKRKEALEFFPELTIYICKDTVSFYFSFLSFLSQIVNSFSFLFIFINILAMRSYDLLPLGV